MRPSNPPETHRAGFTLLEVLLALAMLSIIVVKVSSVLMRVHETAADQTSKTLLSDRTQVALERVARAVMGSNRESLVPDAEDPMSSTNLQFQVNLGVEEGEIVWSDPERIWLEEGGSSVLWARNPDQPDERRVAWTNLAREFLEGELPNGMDDNGNGLIDERGLSSSNVRAEALAALQAVSGYHLGAERARWEEWYAREQRWWRSEGAQAARDLDTLPPEEVSDRLLSLSRHRLFRHALAEAYVEVFARPEEELILLACAALGSLRSWSAVPSLVELLGHESFPVRTAAAQALERITGRTFAHDQALWAAWVRERLATD